MADIAPLTPLRFDLSRLGDDSLAAVICPPYDVINDAQRAELVKRHPENVVQLELPEGEGDTKYQNAANLLEDWKRSGVLVRDEEPAFYRYDQTFTAPGAKERITRRGFFALVKLVPFQAKVVLPHERTLSGPKADRMKLFVATRASLSPGFMLYRDPQKKLDAALETADEIARFTTPDGIEHVLAKVTDKEALRKIVDGVAASSLLVADGHHRYETALAYSDETTSAGLTRPEHQWFMAFLANGDDPELLVFPTHRHVHSLASVDFDALLKGAATLFDVKEMPKGAAADALTAALVESGKSRPSLVACAPDGRAALLSLSPKADLAGHPVLGKEIDALRKTDVALLHMGLLEPVLGITREKQAAKTNIWYPQDAAAALAELRAGKGQVLFLMNGSPVAQVREVAEAGEVMPQKSTFFYPKIPTGLCIHTLEPVRQVASV